MSLIDELKTQKEHLEVEIRRIENRIRNEQLRLCYSEYGITFGSIVKTIDGKEYKITEIDARWSGDPTLKGNPKKKDGTFGKAEQYVYGRWELIK